MYIQISQPQMSSVFAEKKEPDVESKKLQKTLQIKQYSSLLK